MASSQKRRSVRRSSPKPRISESVRYSSAFSLIFPPASQFHFRLRFLERSPAPPVRRVNGSARRRKYRPRVIGGRVAAVLDDPLSVGVNVRRAPRVDLAALPLAKW